MNTVSNLVQIVSSLQNEIISFRHSQADLGQISSKATTLERNTGPGGVEFNVKSKSAHFNEGDVYRPIATSCLQPRNSKINPRPRAPKLGQLKNAQQSTSFDFQSSTSKSPETATNTSLSLPMQLAKQQVNQAINTATEMTNAAQPQPFGLGRSGPMAIAGQNGIHGKMAVSRQLRIDNYRKDDDVPSGYSFEIDTEQN